MYKIVVLKKVVRQHVVTLFSDWSFATSILSGLFRSAQLYYIFEMRRLELYLSILLFACMHVCM